MNIQRVALGVTALGVGAIIMHNGSAPAKEFFKVASGQEIDGKAVYLKSCKECHGVIGAPTKAAQRKYEKIATFADPAFFKKHDHEDLIEAVTKGKGRDMKGFAEKLSKDEIKAVVVYIHTLAKA